VSVRPPIFFFPNSYFADEHGVRGGRRVDLISSNCRSRKSGFSYGKIRL
jgi:hypothetical protein